MATSISTSTPDLNHDIETAQNRGEINETQEKHILAAVRRSEVSGVHEEPPSAASSTSTIVQSNVQPNGQLYGWRLYTVQFCLAFCLILSVMDSSIVATALITIGNYFDDFLQIQWVVLAYLLTYLGFALIFSRISDVIGRKWATVVSLVILGVFSLACGLAQTIEQLIVFRALQGLGGSGLYAMPLTTLPEVTPPEKFPIMSAAMGIVFAVSAVLGPTIGGVITTHSSWRWVFLFNVPCCAFIVVIILFAWPQTQSPGKITWKQLDYFGSVLYVAASVLVVFALQEAGTGTYAWNSGAIIACLVIAFLTAVALAVWIWYFSSADRGIAPLFPARIATHKIILANIMVSTLIGYVFYNVLIELPERFQVVNGKSSQSAGINLMTVSGASAFGSMLGGFLSSKQNRSFYTLTAGSFFATLGAGLFFSLGYSPNIPAALYGYEVLIGFGFGLTFASTTVMIKVQADDEDAAPAQGLMAQSRILGGNIGLAVATIVLNRELSKSLSASGLFTPEEIKSVQGSLNAVETFTAAQREAVGRSFSSAFKIQIQICLILAALSLLLCALTWERHPPSFLEKQNKARMEQRDTAETRSSGEGLKDN